MKKTLALVLIVMLMTLLLAGCGGAGIPDGYYVPEDGIGAGYSSFDFHGKKVTLGLAMGTQSYDVLYTFTPGENGNPGTLSFEMAGSYVDVPAEINADGNLVVGATIYVKQ